MRILTGISFILNIIAWIFAIVFGYALDESLAGCIIVFFGFIGFLIAWNLSGGVVISVADYFFQPEWEVLKNKLKWANGIGISTAITFFVIFSASLVAENTAYLFSGNK